MPNEGDLFNLLGKLELTLGDLSAQAKRRNELQRQARLATVPSLVKFHYQGTVPASGFLVLAADVSGPRQGYYWNVRRISISGITPSTVVGGRADLFVSGMSFGQVTSFNQISMSDWADQAETLPLVGNYGDGELEIHPPDRLHIVVSNGTVNNLIIANGVAQQVQESAATQVMEI